MPPGTVLDGELVCWPAAWTSPPYTRRLSGSTTPAVGLVVFDLLAVGSRDLRREPYAVRREQLAELLSRARLPLALVPMTKDPRAARAWLIEHAAGGMEGVVSKHAGHTYSSQKSRFTTVAAL